MYTQKRAIIKLGKHIRIPDIKKLFTKKLRKI